MYTIGYTQTPLRFGIQGDPDTNPTPPLTDIRGNCIHREVTECSSVPGSATKQHNTYGLSENYPLFASCIKPQKSQVGTSLIYEALGSKTCSDPVEKML